MDREIQINRVLSCLAALSRNGVAAPLLYPIEANRALFQAMLSPRRYCQWLHGRAKRLHPEKLLEISELLPEYDPVLHNHLMTVERNPVLGLIRPLVQRIANLILHAKRPLLLADFGAGGMEVQRQVIASLPVGKKHPLVTFIGFDISLAACDLAQANLASQLPEGISILPSAEACARWLQQSPAPSARPIRAATCRVSIFDLPAHFAPGAFDVIFHSFFRHHLDASVLANVEATAARLGRRVWEYDGYQNWPTVMWASLFSWHNPIFLAATLLSHRRFATRRQLLASHKGSRLRFYGNGCYLREINYQAKRRTKRWMET